jgi:hypothetical protein
MLAAQRKVAQNPGFERGFDALFDLGAVSKMEISAEDVRIVADNAVFGPYSRRAFVTSEPAMLVLIRMLEGFLGDRGGKIEWFSDRAAADRWLDRQ